MVIGCSRLPLWAIHASLAFDGLAAHSDISQISNDAMQSGRCINATINKEPVGGNTALLNSQMTCLVEETCHINDFLFDECTVCDEIALGVEEDPQVPVYLPSAAYLSPPNSVVSKKSSSSTSPFEGIDPTMDRERAFLERMSTQKTDPARHKKHTDGSTHFTTCPRPVQETKDRRQQSQIRLVLREASHAELSFQRRAMARRLYQLENQSQTFLNIQSRSEAIQMPASPAW